MSNLSNNRLVRTFAELRAAGKKTVLPFITAGYPDLATTEALLRDFESRGVRICELGIPFSDPVADGPVIQASYTAALAAGVNSAKVFDMVRRYRAGAADPKGLDRPIEKTPLNARAKELLAAAKIRTIGQLARLTAEELKAVPGLGKASLDSIKRTLHDLGLSQGMPGAAAPGNMALVAMVSYSIVYRHGVADYVRDAAAAGIDGLIVPDLPLEEAGAIEPHATAAGLANVMLIAPTTPPQRRLEIARHCRGFCYMVSVAGITGERTALPPRTLANVADLRKHTDVPICVGFGISRPEMVATVCQAADGAIVGSAIVHHIADAVAAKLPTPQLVRQVGRFVGELLAPVK